MFLDKDDYFKYKSTQKIVRFDSFAFASDNAKIASVALRGVGKNCEINKGALGVGVGCSPIIMEGNTVSVVGNTVKADCLFGVWERNAQGEKQRQIALLGEDGAFWVCRENGAYWSKIHGFGTRMGVLSAIGENGEAVTVFIGPAGVYTYDGVNGLVKGNLERSARVGCYLQGRVFCAVSPCSLAFSTPFKPNDFTDGLDGGGVVKLPDNKGEIVALATLKDKVYIFFEFGICALTPTGSARSFVIEEVGYDGGRIFEGGVGKRDGAVESLLFLAENGVYRFDGAKCVKIVKELAVSPKREKRVCHSAVFEGKYFVTFVDSEDTLRGLVVDLATLQGYYAFAPEGLSSFDGGAIAVCDGVLQRIGDFESLPSGEERTFFVGGLDLGARGLKNLQSVCVYGVGEVELWISSGKKQKTVTLDLSTGVANIKAFLRGRQFSLSLRLKGRSRVTGVTLYHSALVKEK